MYFLLPPCDPNYTYLRHFYWVLHKSSTFLYNPSLVPSFFLLLLCLLYAFNQYIFCWPLFQFTNLLFRHVQPAALLCSSCLSDKYLIISLGDWQEIGTIWTSAEYIILFSHKTKLNESTLLSLTILGNVRFYLL